MNFPWQIRNREPKISLGGILAGREVRVLLGDSTFHSPISAIL